MLYDSMMDKMRFKEKRRVPDDMGTWDYVWADGAEFMGHVKKDTSIDAMLAEKQGIKELYTITVNRDVPLEYNDILERISDGQLFRVKSNVTDSKSPAFSGIDMAQVKAEACQLD